MLMASNNADKFRGVFSAVLGVPVHQISDDLTPEQVDTWDSLNQINLIAALEQEFGVTLSIQNLGDFQTVGKLKALLAEHNVAL
jgi:acyl carrier protein